MHQQRRATSKRPGFAELINSVRTCRRVTDSLLMSTARKDVLVCAQRTVYFILINFEEKTAHERRSISSIFLFFNRADTCLVRRSYPNTSDSLPRWMATSDQRSLAIDRKCNREGFLSFPYHLRSPSACLRVTHENDSIQV